MSWKFRAAFQLAMSWLAIASYAQTMQSDYAARGLFSIQNFDQPGSGAVRDLVSSMVQDARGRMYFGAEGVSVYDGTKWETIPVGAHDASILWMDQDASGLIYVAAQNEIGYLVPDARGQLRYQSLKPKLPAEHRELGDVWSVWATSHGIYFQDTSRLIRWDGRQIRVWPAGDAPFYMSYNIRDTLYVRSDGEGLLRVEGDSLKLVPGSAHLSRVRLDYLMPWGKAEFLAITRREGLQRCGWQNGALRCQSFAPALLSRLETAQPYHATRLSNGWLALATLAGGLWIVDEQGQLVQVIDETTGLMSNEVGFVHADQQENLWVGLHNGVARIEILTPTTYFDTRNGLKGVPAVLLQHEGQRYAATSRGVFVQDMPGNGQPARFRQIPGMDMVCYALRSLPGELLAGCLDGVYQIRNEQRTLLQDYTQAVLALYPSTAFPGRLYVGLADGLAMMEKHQGRWLNRGRLPRLEHGVTSFAEEADGTLWGGTAFNKAVRISAPQTLETLSFSIVEGTPPGRIQAFLYENQIFFGTKEGLFRPVLHRNNNVLSVSLAPETRFGDAFAGGQGEAYFHATTASGGLWIKHREGLVLLQKMADGRFTALQRLSLTDKEDRALYHEPDQDIVWISTLERLIRMDFSAPSPPRTLPAVLVQRLLASHTDSLLYTSYRTASATNLVLSYNLHNLTVEYALPYFASTGTLRYRVRLEGLDHSWSPWTTSTSQQYTNLPEGHYVFHVQAMPQAAAPVVSEATLAFSILPPWYRSWWAYVLYTLVLTAALVSITYAASRHRTRRLAARNEELQQAVAERTEALHEQNMVLASINEELAQTNEALYRSHRTLESRTVALRNALEENKEILGITAHDLKNPLSNVFSLAELLLEDCQAEPPETALYSLQTYGPLIREEAQRMLQIIRNLLDRQRLEEPVDQHREVVSLGSLAQTVLQWNQVQADKKQIRLYYTGDATLQVDVDVAAIQRAVDNLISNAIKYSPAGKQVWVEIQRKGDHALLSIRDEGPGLTPEDKEKVFGKLQRLSAKPTGGEQATGLGLYIVKQIVEQQGGRVGVESTWQQGAMFWLSLPLVAPADGPHAAATASESGIPVRPRTLPFRLA